MSRSTILLSLPLIALVACDDADRLDPQTTPAPAVTAAAPAPAPDHEEPAAPSAAVPGEWSHYGAAFTLTSARPATEVLSAPATFADQTVLVEGKITDVCQKAGCWMVITDDQRTMRVLMKDHAFAVDKGGAGATCRVEGQILAKAVDPDTVAHFASESADTENMPEKGVQSGEIIYELHATGVAMQKPATTEG